MSDSEALTPKTAEALRAAESILSLLHHRGIVDSEHNRVDVAEALTEVRGVLGTGGIYTTDPMPVQKKTWRDRFSEWPF